MSCHHSSVSRLLAAATRVALIGLVVSVATVAIGDTITVCWDGSGDYVTIQEGIDAAVDGDEVVVCDGIYTGFGNKNLDFGGRAITVRSANGPGSCIIDGELDGWGFFFHSGETGASVVEGFTVTNGVGPGGGVSCFVGSSPTIAMCNFTANQGSAIYCQGNSSPTISGCVFTGNTAQYGGAIRCRDESNPTITGCTITGNTATVSGGGINCEGGSPVIGDCIITGNSGGRAVGQAFLAGMIATQRSSRPRSRKTWPSDSVAALGVRGARYASPIA